MEAIYIPRLAQSPNRTEEINIHQFLPGLETLMPVKAQLKVVHQGNYLEVAAQGEAIVTLTCHRCLQQYNHRLAVDARELIWLNEAELPAAGEAIASELEFDELVETLPARGYFQPDTWLYEQLCLAMPLRQLCDRDCQGIQPAQDAAKAEVPAPSSDRRWQALEALKKQFPTN